MDSLAQLAGVAPTKYWQTLPNLFGESFVFLRFDQRKIRVPWVFMLLLKLDKLRNLGLEVLKEKYEVALLQVAVHDLDQIGS